MAVCFYCGGDGKLTRAHLFQDGFRKLIGPGDGGVNLGSSSSSIPGVERAISHRGDIRQAKVTSLCEPCNRGWMEPIEVGAGTAFKTIMEDGAIPAPLELIKLGHWAVVVAVLSSELYPRLQIPAVHRDAVRNATGLPAEYATYFVWTSEYLDSLQVDLYRVIDDSLDDERGVNWYHFLHAGPIVAISCSPRLVGRLAQVLRDAGINSVLGCIGETMIYVPPEFQAQMAVDGNRPTHQEVHDLGPSVVGERSSFIQAENGTDLLDLSAGTSFSTQDLSFDFTGTLFDYRQLAGPSRERH